MCWAFASAALMIPPRGYWARSPSKSGLQLQRPARGRDNHDQQRPAQGCAPAVHGHDVSEKNRMVRACWTSPAPWQRDGASQSPVGSCDQNPVS